jgi:predicted TIM-barrel fold metal-dependent hydrolase
MAPTAATRRSAEESRTMRMVLLLSAVFALAAQQPQPTSPNPPNGSMPNAQTESSELQALAPMDPVDTHTHVAKGDPAFYGMLKNLHMHIVDILVVDRHSAYRKGMQPQLQDALQVVRESDGHAALCTTFDPFPFEQPDFAESAIRGLNRDFAAGAVAVKIWKNIGMDLKDRNGHYILPDNPVFEPIYQDIERHNRTLISHVADPDEAWLPPNPKGVDYSYYQENPIWYMYGKAGAPTKQQILDARDHILAQNPKLRMVGAHLGSMEDDLPLLAKHLDEYPNFAVDTAARVPHLVVMPSQKVRAFLLKYQDRIVYGTDLEFLKNEDPKDALKEWQEQYAMDWRYFATTDTFDYFGQRVHGLGLPRTVLRKLYHDNAMRWFPLLAFK